ncbi:rhomboid family intramembrane serine protease [Mycobacterium sp. MS1601]|uniref:rhomboid family intramembrane serine protease n=1 Tax=Mycobacterium sp. MS1601 TaxID=1936029 RepID=UPI00097929AD|nr:rhomboid family intramembrane serine protease [Mycobacterium sp. MS1601]AQA03390.1 rhomboid family intramembrane serine protease [Mycobacterium sp. MS1601]
MSYPGTPPPPPTEVPTCYRHPDRQTYVRCNRCGRFICGECMRSAAVGHQCVECVNEGNREVRQVRGQFGGLRPNGTVPVVTYTLIAVNLVAFVLQMAIPDFQSSLVLWPPAVADGEWYRLVTSAFLHYGVMHILFNMLVLYVMGPQLEQMLGRLRFSVLYGASAIGGSVVVYLLSPLNSGTAGASGAIYGLFGATFVVAKKMNLDLRPVLAVIGLNVAFTLIVPLISSQNISWQGHLGGLLTGALVTAAFVYAPRQRQSLVQSGLIVALLAVFIVLIVWRTQALYAQFGIT